MELMRLRVSITVCRDACAARVARFCAICPFKGPPRKCAPSPHPRSDRDFTADDYEALRALDEGLDSRRGAPRDLIRSLPVERLPSGAAPRLPARPWAAAWCAWKSSSPGAD